MAVIASSAHFNFYPRPPRGGRPDDELQEFLVKLFLSTPSARRATWAITDEVLDAVIISIHALREEGDHPRVFHRTAASKFLSTPSARRATKFDEKTGLFENISIHALREEGDQRRGGKKSSVANFYPRPPRGGRRINAISELYDKDFYPRPPRGGRPEYLGGTRITIKFLSTPSARRATQRFQTALQR